MKRVLLLVPFFLMLISAGCTASGDSPTTLEILDVDVSVEDTGEIAVDVTVQNTPGATKTVRLNGSIGGAVKGWASVKLAKADNAPPVMY